jgi:hypothetical protein
MRIVLVDELDFPSSLSTIDPLFPLHCGFQCVVALEPDQSIDAVFCSEPGDGFHLVLPDPPDKI